ncbi:hypothetical protein [Sulfurimonas sp.]|uniref:hypothetical protein n=1 Tax=Sulfurimonas sp. TaxID=2022749 RepID=UPI002615F7CF|nr:hypothetical protein [Sulfurimonas sp.]MCW8895565.1 hypothetical protein [Sulfurimonas sp.]
MSEDFNKLKDIGIQKIHETTHISRLHVQSFLDENFDDMTKIQFLGFVSILEREYGVDLSDLKAKFLENFAAETKKIEAEEEEGEAKLFLTKKKRNFTVVYIAIALIIFVLVATSTLMDSNNTSSEIETIDNSMIENAKNNMAVTSEDINSSAIEENEENNESISEVKEQEPLKQADKSEVLSFKIIPKHKLWLGYIDLSTHKRDQKLFSDELSLDPDKNWLLTLGHGYISIEINGETKEFTNPKTVRFSYINKELKELSFQEFKKLNRDSEW